MGRSRSPKKDRSRGRRERSRDRGEKRDRSGDRDRRSKKEKEPVDDDKFRPGRQVIVKGLQKNPEKNGAIGKLIEFNKDKGRWVVELSAGNINFKEENLELMPDNSDVVNDNEEPPTAKVYIVGLPAATTDEDIIKLFGSVGVIAKQKPKGRAQDRGKEDSWPFAVKLYKPGRDNGDGCVEYMDPYAAKAAIKTYNRYKFNGSKLGVSYAGEGRVYKEVELQLPWHLRDENQGKLDREGGGGGKGEGGAQKRPGDWVCPSCGADVYASKDNCFKCGAGKPDGVEKGAGPSLNALLYCQGGKGGGKDGGKDGGKGGKDRGKDGDKGGKSWGGGKDRW